MSDPPAPRRLRLPITTAVPTIDELSTIRYVHAGSMQAAAREWASDDDLAAYAAHMYEPAYGDDIVEAIAREAFIAAYLDGRLIGTCGWSPVAEEPDVARIRWCHVEPMFARFGAGLSLLLTAEASAERSGYVRLLARSTPNATAFFERVGYGVTSYGSRSLADGRTVPVTFLRKRLVAPDFE